MEADLNVILFANYNTILYRSRSVYNNMYITLILIYCKINTNIFFCQCPSFHYFYYHTAKELILR